MTWNEPRVALVRKLWADGLSASHIANRLGDTTRNAVIGKIHRLGLSGRAKRRAADRPATPKRSRERRKPHPRMESLRHILGPSHEPRAEPDTLASAAVGAKRVTIADLEPCHCKWPLWETDDDPRTYCGQDRADGLPYCAAHARIAFRMPSAPQTVRELYASRRNLVGVAVKLNGPEPVEV